MTSLQEAFAARVSRRGDDECWPWVGCIRHDGYGQFSFQRRRYIASRVALELATGLELGRLRACHHCDNPRCVNPKHLFPGTDRDNAKDRCRKLRSRGQRSTECKAGHAYTPENTYMFNGKRHCRACNRAAVARLKRRRSGGKA